jgi:hypothetical protein
MAKKYINIFQSKGPPKLTQIGIFGLNLNHLATLVGPQGFVPFRLKQASYERNRLPDGMYFRVPKMPILVYKGRPWCGKFCNISWPLLFCGTFGICNL